VPYPWIAAAAVSEVASQLNSAREGRINQCSVLTEFLHHSNQLLHGEPVSVSSDWLGEETAPRRVHKPFAELIARLLDS
jgi:hypothetical protein